MDYMEERIAKLKQLDNRGIDEFVEYYQSVLSSSENSSSKPIGANCLCGGVKVGGVKSSERNFLTQSSIIALVSSFDMIYCTTGDMSNAYRMIIEELQSRDSIDFFDATKLVFETVQKYFGNTSEFNTRMEHFPDEDEIAFEGKERGKISDLEGKNAAACVERAALSHNLMKMLGIDSTYKMSGVLNGENKDAHAYNLVKYNGKAYIFDATIPRGLENGEITPLITEIQEEAYEKMCSGESKDGHSVHVEYFSPLSNQNRSITYDAGHIKEKGLDR